MTRLKFNEIYFVPDIQSKRQICVNIQKKDLKKLRSQSTFFSKPFKLFRWRTYRIT